MKAEENKQNIRNVEVNSLKFNMKCFVHCLSSCRCLLPHQMYSNHLLCFYVYGHYGCTQNLHIWHRFSIRMLEFSHNHRFKCSPSWMYVCRVCLCCVLCVYVNITACDYDLIWFVQASEFITLKPITPHAIQSKSNHSSAKLRHI